MEIRSRPVSGFTLLELMTAVALVAILVAVAIPSYQSLRQEQMVRAATQAVYTDMMLLKSEAVKRNKNLSLNVFNSGLSNWCYRIAIDGSCTSCTDNCSSLEGRKGADASDFPGITLTSSYSGSAVTFSPRRGTLESGHIELATNNYITQVVTYNTGRVYTCAPSNSLIGGERVCP
ncbi:GspH/FimT family pseudopilin [Aeromonas sanarellii]